jgi:broad specificity phosphatase PhoE
MKIIFIRHAESEANIAHVINDDPARPVPLTAYGRQQAQAAAKALRALPFIYAYASQFLRTQQTAEILLQGRDCPFDIDARLNERHTGMDGLHVDVFNELVRPDLLYTRPPGGETFVEQMERLRSFMNEIAARHPQGTVLAVSHENPILAALAVGRGEPEVVVRGSVGNCEWVEVECRG